jgi:hypothetical protein
MLGIAQFDSASANPIAQSGAAAWLGRATLLVGVPHSPGWMRLSIGGRRWFVDRTKPIETSGVGLHPVWKKPRQFKACMLTFNQRVDGSIPSGRTNKINKLQTNIGGWILVKVTLR